MTHSPGGTNSPDSLRDDRVASTADRVPEPDGKGTTGRATTEGGNFLEEPPTVISSQKNRDSDSTTGRHPSMTELTLGRELVGQTLGHFQLDAFVGAGGMGAVFRGHDTRLNRRVAVKVLSGEHNTREDTVRRFQNEAQSAARLDHPNIARVYFVGEERGWNYIVFEFIDGVNVRDEVERHGPLETELAISYLVQVAEALDHASKRDIVHRDIKPSNILVDSQHRAKLVDMGLARLHQVNSPDNDLTASGMTLGTFDYISPEQARDPRSADVRSDLYSLGCTFFFMLTGRPPFPEGTVLQKLLSHSGEEPPDPREFRPEVPDEVVLILSRLMAKNPNDRYQQPGELIAAALVVIDDLGLAAPHVTSAVYVPTQEQRATLIERHLPWALPTIILLVVVFVLDAIWTAKDDSYLSDPSYLSADEMQALVDEGDLLGGVAPISAGPTIDAGNVIPIPVEPDKPPSQVPPPRSMQPAEEKPSAAPAETISPATESGAGSPATVAPGSETSAPVSSGASPSGAASPASATSRSAPSGSPSSASASPMADGSAENAADVAAVEENVLVVPDQAVTLYEALTKAKANSQIDTIELRYDGQRYERPLLVENTNLSVRAGKGFRPTIVFAPQEEEPVDRMVLVSGSSLTLQGIGVRMTIPQNSMRAWSLFALESADRLVLNGCQVTVHRADEAMIPEGMRDTSVVAVRAPRPDAAVSDMAKMRSRLITIDDSLIRGEASLVRSSGRQALRITCRNSLLALSGNLLNSISTTTESMVEGSLNLTLNNCTADTGASLIRRDGSSGTPLQVLQASIHNSALRWGQSTPMLWQRSSAETTDAMLKLIRFFVERNCYQQQGSTLMMMRLESSANSTNAAVEVDYSNWVRTWEDHFSARTASMWAAAPAASVPYSSRTLSDYALLDELDNPAVRPNEGNAGVDFEELPFAPSPLAGTEKPSDVTTD